MKPVRKLNRRSFFTRVAGSAVAAGGALGLVGGARAGQVTDIDSGINGDPVGRGRGGSRPGSTGVTDGDPGRNGDLPGRGRGSPRTSRGVTDRDTGRYGDLAGRGRGSGPPRQSVTDSDTGPGSDPIGRGRSQQQGAVTDAAQRQERCTALATRINELEQRARQPEGWTDEQLRQAENDQFVVGLTIQRQENLGRQVMRRDITSADGNRQLMSLHGDAGAIAGRYGLSYNNDFFALDAALRNQIGRARAAGPQRAALQQERARIAQEFQSLNCFR